MTSECIFCTEVFHSTFLGQLDFGTYTDYKVMDLCSIKHF